MAAIRYVKINLYDSEREILVETVVSEADAKRAHADVYFASELLRRTLNQNPHAASTSTAYVQYDDHEETPESFCEDEVPINNKDTGEINCEDEVLINNEDTGETNCEDEVPINNEDTGETNCETEESEGGVSSYRWTSPAVLLLLESYRSMEDIRNRGKMSQKQMWKKISEELIKKGYTVTGPQCDSKLRSLKKTFKATKDHNNKSGNDRKTWQYFQVMDEMFGQKAWCDPVAVASSTGLSLKKLDNNDSAIGSDSGCSSKSNKTPIAILLGKRLKQREEHEENKNKRHKERMEMDAKFLKVLEKLAEK